MYIFTNEFLILIKKEFVGAFVLDNTNNYHSRDKTPVQLDYRPFTYTVIVLLAFTREK